MLDYSGAEEEVWQGCMENECLNKRNQGKLLKYLDMLFWGHFLL